MEIKIRTSNGSFPFGLSVSKYESFATLIICGYTEWVVDASEVPSGTVPGFSLDSEFLVDGWNTAGKRIQEFLKRYSEQDKLKELIESLENSSSPGNLLDSLVN